MPSSTEHAHQVQNLEDGETERDTEDWPDNLFHALTPYLLMSTDGRFAVGSRNSPSSKSKMPYSRIAQMAPRKRDTPIRRRNHFRIMQQSFHGIDSGASL